MEFRIILRVVVGFLCLCALGFLSASTTPNYYLDEQVMEKEKLISSFSKDAKIFHLVSHGRPGELLINGEWLDKEDLVDFLKSILPSSIDQLYVYGCSFSANEGEIVRQYLEQELKLKIYASDNITGIDGDWIIHRGHEKVILPIKEYPYNLQGCISEYTLEPSDFNFLEENFTGLNATADMSSRFGLPEGSIIVEIENGYVFDYPLWGHQFSVTHPNIEPVTRFRFSGNIGVRVKIEHGRALEGQQEDGYVRDRFFSQDAFTFVNTALSEGLVAGASPPLYYVENRTDELIINENEENFTWISDQDITPNQPVNINTTNTIINDGKFNNRIHVSIIPNYCDYLSDVSLNYDNICDERTGEIDLYLNANIDNEHACYQFSWIDYPLGVHVPSGEKNPVVKIPRDGPYEGTYIFRVAGPNGETCRLDSMEILAEINCAQALAIQDIQWQITKDPSDEGINIDWKIISDVSIRNLKVQKSIDGKNFSTIKEFKVEDGIVLDVGHLVDAEHAPYGQIYYYRMEIEDQSGYKQLSSTKPFEFSRSQTFRVYPNPATNKLHFSQLPKRGGNIKMFNIVGTLVYQTSKPESLTEYDLTIDFLPSGIYYVKVADQATRIVVY